MTMTENFEEKFLGRIVEDMSSGFNGYATSITYRETGSVQVGIQPASDGKTLPDPISIDVELIRLLETEKPVLPYIPVPNPTNYLGQTIVEKTTGLLADASSRIVFLNGCEYYYVRHKNLSKEGTILLTMVATQNISLVPQPQAEKAKAEPVKRTGGPAAKVMRPV